MGLVSSKVVAGTKILADHFNKLWTDLTENHDHATNRGGTIDHADLADTGPMSGYTFDHSDMDTHIGTGNTDNPGGSMGVHGLHASAYVMGSAGQINQTESANPTFTGKQLVALCGIFTILTPSPRHDASVSFGSFSFSETPVVVAVLSDDEYDAAEIPWVRVHTVTTTGFQVVVSENAPDGVSVHWLATGVKT